MYALLDRSDECHERAASIFPTLRRSGAVTHNYVVVECVALTQSRLGLAAVRRLLDDLLPVVSLTWVDEGLHRRAAAGLLASSARAISLVDRVSFAFMRDAGIAQAFAFDQHFRREGFTLLEL